MITLTTTIQEITLQAYAFGAYDILFNEQNKSRDEVLNIFEEWGKEFAKEEQKHHMETDWFYYDEADLFIQNKIEQLKNGRFF